MRRIVSLLLPLALVLVALPPAATLAQEGGAGGAEGSVQLSEDDLDAYREVAAEALAQIDAEILVLQEGIDDPDTVALQTPSGPRIYHLSHLPAALQVEALLFGRGVDDIPDRLALWLPLDELGLVPESVFTPTGIAEIAAGMNAQAEREIETLLAEKAEIELFLEWLEQESVVAVSGDFASSEGPYQDSCIFRTGYFLDRSKFPVTQVVAWRSDDFDPSRARFEYAAATPNEEAEDPNDRIARMRESVAAMKDVTVVYDGSFSGFCAWAEATCPGTVPLFGGISVCEDGRPAVE